MGFLLLRCSVEDMIKVRTFLVKKVGISWGEVGRMTTEEISLIFDNIRDKQNKVSSNF